MKHLHQQLHNIDDPTAKRGADEFIRSLLFCQAATSLSVQTTAPQTHLSCRDAHRELLHSMDLLLKVLIDLR